MSYRVPNIADNKLTYSDTNSSDIIISIVNHIAWPLKVYIRLKEEAVLGNLCELGRFHHSDTKGIGIGEAKRADEH